MVGSQADAIWLDVLQTLCGQAAHELKGALNGVSVNLEVVRSRSAKADLSDASAEQLRTVSKYADAAVEQLGAVIAMSEALLALSRPEREPADVGLVIRRIEALLGPAARADGRRLEVDPMVADLGPTSADGTALRIAVGAALLGALESSVHVTCRPEDAMMQSQAVHAGPVVRIECHDGRAAAMPALDPVILDVLTEAGIHIHSDHTEASALLIGFPR